MEVKVAVITSVCSLIGVIITAVFNALGNIKSHNKMLEVSDLTLYRLEQLEKKQDKHNNLIERTYKTEEEISLINEKIKVANHRIDDLEREAK